jgi:hypothetical protein
MVLMVDILRLRSMIMGNHSLQKHLFKKQYTILSLACSKALLQISVVMDIKAAQKRAHTLKPINIR